MTSGPSGLGGRLRPGHAATVAIGLLALYPVIRPYDTYVHGVFVLAFLLAVQAVSWNIISGYAGYISLGHAAFLGLGSYTAGILALRMGVNPLVFAPLCGLVAVVVAVAIGAVVLRTRGPAFVIITVALLLSAQVVAINWSSLTGGSDGLTMPLPPWSRDIQNLPFYYMFFVLMLATIGFSAWIRRTKFGTGLVAIREDEGKAAAIGVDTTRYKVVAFAASTFFIGVAGPFYAYYLTFLNPVGAFNILGAVMIVLAALVGGRGTLWGPVVGAFIVQAASEVSTVYGGGAQSRVLLFGVALVLVVLFMPAGLIPTIGEWWRRRHPAPVVYTDEPQALARDGHIRVAENLPAEHSAHDRPREHAEPSEHGGQSERAEPSEHAEPLLDVRGVSKRFGGLAAVDGAGLAVRKGSITALIGPNGSGKTTLFNLVTGNQRADAGRILFSGRRIDHLPPWTRGHLGLGRTFQVTRLFKSMTVLENMTAPLPNSGPSAMFAGASRGHETARALDLLGFVGLGRFADHPAGSLSYGQQKLVELAQVLMLRPELVLLDEPAGGINPALVDRMMELVRDLSARGMTFLVVEHNIPLVIELCDPIVVLARGAVIAEGPPASIPRDPAVLDAYLGDGWAGGHGSARQGPDAGPAGQAKGAR